MTNGHEGEMFSTSKNLVGRYFSGDRDGWKSKGAKAVYAYPMRLLQKSSSQYQPFYGVKPRLLKIM